MFGLVREISGARLLAGLSLSLACVLAAPLSAAAQGLYSLDREVKKVGGWTIAVNKQRRGCLAYGEFQSGTAVELGYDSKKDAGFLLFANEEWDFVKSASTFDVRLVFNGNNRWRAQAKGVQIGDLYALAFEGVKEQFIIDFAAYSSVKLEVEGVKLEGISLRGTMDAVQAMIDCSSYVSGQ